MSEVTPPCEIRVLGELSILRGGRQVSLPASKKTRALLGYLAVTDRPQTREKLCELFWQGPDDPRAALRWSLSKLRTCLGAPALEADRERVCLGPVATDLKEVRALVSRGLGVVDTADLASAASRFRGELCEGLGLLDCYGYQAWQAGERQAARALHVSFLKALLQRFASEPGQALGWARNWVSIEPLSESAHAAVVRALAKLGRRREALEQYETCVRILEQELGSRPSPELLDARMQIGAAPSTAPPEKVVGQLSPAVAAAASDDHGAEPATASPDDVGSADAIVGRKSELAIVDEMLGRSHGRETLPVLCLFGEPGIGKSRMLQELARRAVNAGGVVLGGRAFEPEMVRPYGPWIDALGRLPAGRVPEALRSRLTALLPELGGDGAQDRAALFDAVTRLLVYVAASSSPLVLVLDDAHWFDEASAALLHYVARALELPGVLIACGARPGELSDNAPALRTFRGLLRENRARTIELGPLAPEDIATLARRLSPLVDADQVARESEGNPLLAFELSRALRSGSTTRGSVSGLIAERLGRLDSGAAELLSFAAALGKSFDLTILERVAAVAPRELVARIGEFERHGLVRASSDGNGFDFCHDLLRAGAYHLLSEPRRRLVHRTIARAMAEDGVGSPLAAEIAHHASLGGDGELAVRAALVAAQRCLRIFAGEEAVRLAELGLMHVGSLSRNDSIKRRLELLSVHVYSGSPLGRTARIQSELTRAVFDADEAGLAAEAAAGFHVLSVSQFDTGDLKAAHMSTLRAADAAREAGPDERANQLGGSARCLAMLERDLESAEAMYSEALRLAEQHGTCTVTIEHAGGYLAAHAGNNAEARSHFERALHLARNAEDRWSEFESLRALVQLDIDESNGNDGAPVHVPSGASDRTRELLDVAAKMGDGSELALARSLDALDRYCRAEQDAEPLLDEALAGLRGADIKGILAYVLAVAAERDVERGRLEAAAQRAQEALRAAEAVSRRSQAALARVVLARVALLRRNRVEAKLHVVDLLPARERRQLSARARAAVGKLANDL